jgi:hypothetical protein
VWPGYPAFFQRARRFLNVKAVFADDRANDARDCRVAQDLLELNVVHKCWSAAVIDMPASYHGEPWKIKLPLRKRLLIARGHAKPSKQFTARHRSLVLRKVKGAVLSQGWFHIKFVVVEESGASAVMPCW